MLNYQGSAVLKTDTLHIAVHLGKPRDQIFSNHQESKQVVLAFSTENIYLQEMKSITYLATYMFRLQKQVVCSFVESSRRFKKEKQQFLSTQWTCLQCEHSGGTISRWLRLYKKGGHWTHLRRVKQTWQKNRDNCSQKRTQCSLPRSSGGRAFALSFSS